MYHKIYWHLLSQNSVQSKNLNFACNRHNTKTYIRYVLNQTEVHVNMKKEIHVNNAQ